MIEYRMTCTNIIETKVLRHREKVYKIVNSLTAKHITLHSLFKECFIHRATTKIDIKINKNHKI